MAQEQTAELLGQMFLYGICGGHAGEDCVAADPVFGFMHGNQLGEMIDGSFAGAISDLRDIRHQSADRGNVDDAAAALPRSGFLVAI